jgi:hypothetical protein
MVKNIKKSLKYPVIIIAIMIMIPVVFYVALQFPEVQTFLVHRITDHFSKELQSSISVGNIEYRFFNKLSINDILIKDRNDDTLIYSKNISASIRKIDVRHNTIRIGRITLIKPVIALITDTSGMMNLNWYLDILRGPEDTTKSSSAGRFNIGQVELIDGRFSLINRSEPEGKSKIDFNNLYIKDLNGNIEDIRIENDTTTFNVYRLRFREHNGFNLNKLNSSVTLANNYVKVNSLFISCDSSVLNIPGISLAADSTSSFKNFVEDVKIDIQFDKSLINTCDLQFFLPFLEGTNESVWLSGRVFGTIAELRGRNIRLLYRDNTYLDCDFDFSGLPKIENAFAYIGVNSLKTNANDLDKIRVPGGRLTVPDIIYKMGNISFDGSFTGFTTDFVTYGKLNTEKGNFRTDLSLRPEQKGSYRIKGLLTGTNVDLGELTGNKKLLGALSLQTNIDGTANSLNKFAVNLTGKIDSIEINNYKYRNIALNGFFTEKTWDGSVNVADDNIRLDVTGMFNFKDKLPEFNFRLNLADAKLYKLNFEKIDTASGLSMILTSNFKGDNIDNLDGEIRLVNLKYLKNNNKLELSDFAIKTFLENNKPVLSLRTDFVDADAMGYYNFSGISSLVKSTLSNLMPSWFEYKIKPSELKKNNFSLTINFKNTDRINNFFNTGILLSDKSYIRGEIRSDSIINFNGTAKSLTVKNNIFKDFSFNTSVTGNVFSFTINSSSLNLLNQSELKDFSIGLRTKPDNFIFNLNWDNKEKNLNKGDIIARGVFTKNVKAKGNPTLIVYIDSTDIYTKNNPWKISQSDILVDSNSVKINKLIISNKGNYYMLDGALSEDPLDTLHFGFRGIDIAPLTSNEDQNKDKNSDNLALDPKGLLNGKILLTGVYNNLLIESDILINNFSLLGSDYGNLKIITAFDKNRNVINVKSNNNLKGVRMIDVNGYYDPAVKKLDLTAIATKLPIEILNPLLKAFASGIAGVASGKVNLSGEPGKFVLKGSLFAENATLKIDFLQAKYKLNDSIRFDKNAIRFRNVKLTDEKGNIVTLAGSVNHEYFHDFAPDLTINSKDAMVLNTKPKDNPLFYGTAYASGITTIKSGKNVLSFDISAKTGKNTRFFIPLNNSMSVADYSFISFTDTAAGRPEDKGRIMHNAGSAVEDTKTGMNVNFDLEVTPDAEVQLIFDPKVGDIMKGHGSGNLNINLDENGEFRIVGDYIIEEGDYLFTLRNILNKPFSVENGGKIIFNGNIDNADIDIKAIYKLKASLFDLLQDERYNERIPVECQLNLSGKLFNPVVSFNIYLPTADEETRTYVRNAISTEEELSRQFLYLLIMNSFYADPTYSSASSSTTATGTSAMAVTTTEMLSNQLSNLLSQISNDFDIGFVYRPGSGMKDINHQEVQVALSTKLLNDKVVINGNFDVRGTGRTAENTDKITGDFDAEVKLTEKIRFKVFNRFNNTTTGKGPYTQGIGIFFKKDFDKLPDLFRKKQKSEMKKEEETKIKEEENKVNEN